MLNLELFDDTRGITQVFIVDYNNKPRIKIKHYKNCLKVLLDVLTLQLFFV